MQRCHCPECSRVEAHIETLQHPVDDRILIEAAADTPATWGQEAREASDYSYREAIELDDLGY